MFGRPPSVNGSTYLAKLFHSFPHVNVSLHYVNSTFDPESSLYIESLGILGSIPAAWLILTLFLVLMYLLTKCCDRKARPKHSILFMKWTLAAFAIICLGTVCVSLYGNDDFHTGMQHSITSARVIDMQLTQTINQTDILDQLLRIDIRHNVMVLREVFDGRVQDQTARHVLLDTLEVFDGNLTIVLASANDIGVPIKVISLTRYINLWDLFEFVRWSASMVVYSLLIIFCILLLFGVARHSRCTLILFSVVGLFAIIISFLSASIYLVASVATADLCINPNAYVRYRTPPSFRADMLPYYLSCDSNRANPYKVVIRKGSDAADNLMTNMLVATRIAKELYNENTLRPHMHIINSQVQTVLTIMKSLPAILECRNVYAEYMRLQVSLCETSLYGLAVMLVSALASGLFFTILVWLDSHTWIYIRKKREYRTISERDMLLGTKRGIPLRNTQQSTAGQRTLRPQGRDVNGNGNGNVGAKPIGTISNQRLAAESAHYATLNHRKFHTLEHPNRNVAPIRGRPSVNFDSYTLGHGNAQKQRQPSTAANGQYATLSRKCKTLEANDFY